MKSISEIATSNGLFRPVFQGKIDTANLTFGDASHVDWSWAPPAEVRRPRLLDGDRLRAPHWCNSTSEADLRALRRPEAACTPR